MSLSAGSRLTLCAVGFLVGCNSEVPVPASIDLNPPGYRVTVTRVATHPFLARFNLKLIVTTATGCSTVSDLFPDTGGVSRRNVYLGDGMFYSSSASLTSAVSMHQRAGWS